VEQEQVYLQTLQADEDDDATRAMYADWLDEQGRHDEAERQRKWPEAKAWLVELLAAHEGQYWEDEDGNMQPSDEWSPDFKEFVETVQDSLENLRAGGHDPWGSFTTYNNNSLADAINSNREQFWRVWSVLTGDPPPPEDRDYFRCGC